MTLNEHLKQAREKQQALGHFNFATADVLKAIVEAAKEAGAPAVMVGTSEGEAEFLGMAEAVALVAAAREEHQFPVFLNADHFKSYEAGAAAIDAGYDSVLFDGSKISIEENVATTKRVVAYARASGREVTVEGELGYLRGSSEVQEKVEISPADYTQPDMAQKFVAETGIDRLAIVFGNIHGIVTEQAEHLDIEHLKKLVAAVPNIHLVLHGASGLADTEVAAAIKAGIVNVHFNTELRVAYREALDEAFHKKPNETTPYKYLGPADEAVKAVVRAKLDLFLGK